MILLCFDILLLGYGRSLCSVTDITRSASVLTGSTLLFFGILSRVGYGLLYYRNVDITMLSKIYAPKMVPVVLSMIDLSRSTCLTFHNQFQAPRINVKNTYDLIFYVYYIAFSYKQVEPPEDFIMSLRAETKTGHHRARHTIDSFKPSTMHNTRVLQTLVICDAPSPST